MGETSRVNNFSSHECNLHFCDFLCKSHEVPGFSNLHSCGVVTAHRTSIEIYDDSVISQTEKLCPTIGISEIDIHLFVNSHTVLCLGLQSRKK